MKLKHNFLTFFVMFILTIYNGGYLYAQEAGDIDDTPQESGSVVIEPRDDELASLLSAQPNSSAIVRPLIQTKWGQGTPYNNLFPIYTPNSTNNTTVGQRVAAGCGNIAWAQLMAFHRHPARGRGASGSTQVRFINVPSVNFSIAYDWDNILNSYRVDGRDSNERQRNAVAALVYHVGAARDGTNKNDREQMINIFGYDRSLQRLERRFYSDTEWETIIRQQLDAGLPVWYWGNDSRSDHAFIVDGYDNTGRFHINWGWRGSRDGWYSLNNLNPLGRREWYNNHRIFINFKPDTGGVSVGYEMALLNFSTNKTSVSQNEMFTVNYQFRNTGTERSLDGQAGAALVDNKGNIVAIIGTRSAGALNTGLTGSARELSCIVPETVSPGHYSLRIVYRPENGQWGVITRSAIGNNVPNAISLTVNRETGTPGGGYGLGLTVFTASRTTVSHNERFTVNYRFRNMGSERTLDGEAGAALVDNNGNIVAIIGTRSAGALNAGLTGSARELDCTVPNTVRHGRYQLRMVVRPTGGEWRIATQSTGATVPTSIDFEVN